MQYQDYYASLGIERTATLDDIKRAFRKLARKYHPDVSKEPDAEARFKEVAEAYKALKDPEKRAAYDALGRDYRKGEDFAPPPDWQNGFSFRGRGNGADQEAGDGESGDQYSDFFSSLFGRGRFGAQEHGRGSAEAPGEDRHARITIDVEDAYQGAQRTITLRVPALDAQGHSILQERQLAVNIPKGIRAGQHLRLAGQGGAGSGRHPAGDLYLEVAFGPHPRFRVDSADVFMDLPVAPWEAALGAAIAVATPGGPVELTVPPGSGTGRRLRLRGRGLPGAPAGDLYAVLAVTQPPAVSAADKAAYADLARAFPKYAPRGAPEA